jgi:hypothetical protein
MNQFALPSAGFAKDKPMPQPDAGQLFRKAIAIHAGLRQIEDDIPEPHLRERVVAMRQIFAYAALTAAQALLNFPSASSLAAAPPPQPVSTRKKPRHGDAVSVDVISTARLRHALNLKKV